MFEVENCSCQYNSGVDCNPADRCCGKCGWNPEVADERLRKIVERLYSEAKAKKESNN